AWQPCLRLSKNDPLRCGSFRLRRSLADGPEACLCIVRARLGKVEKRRRKRAGRHSRRQGAASRYCGGIPALRHSRRPLDSNCMRSYLDFEKPVAEIEAKIDELRALHGGD